MPRKPRKISLIKASLHPSEVAFLLDDEKYCRPHIIRDKVSLEELRQGRSGLLYGMKSAGELLEEFGQEALAIFEDAHPEGKPSWFPLLRKLDVSWASAH
jgi:hypothetical protein